MKLPAILLLLIGFAIRFWASGLARFTGDESHYWFLSRQLATLSEFPIYGPAITGSEASLPGALYYYLMAIPQLLGSSPRIGATAVGLGHIASGWLLYRLLKQARGERAALLGLALAMLTPWDILYADRIWGSCVVPILGSVAIYAAVRAKGSELWQGVLLVTCLVLPQLHLSAPVLWVACGVIVFLRPVEWKKRAVLIAGVVVFLAYLPMLIAELRSGFSNTRLILSKAGGAEPWSTAAWAPFNVFAYAVIYGSADISYHFARGYWGGYDSVARYATLSGWRTWFSQEGIWLGALTTFSVVCSLAAWSRTLACSFTRWRSALKARSREALELDEVVLLGLLSGLVAAVALLALSRKGYFPHYANVLMPMLLWPVALGLDSLWGAKTKWAVVAATLISMVAMTVNVVRYYREVDGLNGLNPTLDMVEAILDEPRPVSLRFTHFNNTFAWTLVARGVYKKELQIQSTSDVQWLVRNDEPHRGDLPPGGRLFGPVLVVRTQRAAQKPPGVIWRAYESWRTIEVTGKTTCKASSGSECRYGDQPWQHLKPDEIQIGGQQLPLLFFHPISNQRAVAKLPIPEKARAGILRYGLSDQAHESTNHSPVEITLKQGETLLASLATGDSKGLQTEHFTLSATAAPELSLEIRTENDGARVFGFDIDLLR